MENNLGKSQNYAPRTPNFKTLSFQLSPISLYENVNMEPFILPLRKRRFWIVVKVVRDWGTEIFLGFTWVQESGFEFSSVRALSCLSHWHSQSGCGHLFPLGWVKRDNIDRRMKVLCLGFSKQGLFALWSMGFHSFGVNAMASEGTRAEGLEVTLVIVARFKPLQFLHQT